MNRGCRDPSHAVGVGVGGAEHRARIPFLHVLSMTSASHLKSLNFVLHLEMRRPYPGPCSRRPLGEISSHRSSLPGPAPGALCSSSREAPSDFPPHKRCQRAPPPIHASWLKPRLASDITPLTPRWRHPDALGLFKMASFKKMEA